MTLARDCGSFLASIFIFIVRIALHCEFTFQTNHHYKYEEQKHIYNVILI